MPVTEGEVIRKQSTGPYGILFFAAPKEGYALSAMGAKDTLENYFTISDGAADGSGSDFLSEYGNYKNLVEKGGYTMEQLQGILTEAIEKGCDGALFFSRGANEGAVTSVLTFYAERLPTLEKHIVSVQDRGSDVPRPYQEGESVGEGDTIFYELAVTFYPLVKPAFSVQYTDMTVLDQKTGNGADNSISIQPPGNVSQITQPETVTVPVSYTVVQEDVARHVVVNEAQLSYHYQSLHSAGALAATSSDAAAIEVHASVEYQYVSGTDGMALPQTLEEMEPEDLTYHPPGEQVTVQSHGETAFLDMENGGLWTLEEEGLWRADDGQTLAPGGAFSMPACPITLTARWTFAPRPFVTVRKAGELKTYTVSDEGQVSYTAGYEITVENTGGEALETVSISDETLPEDLSALVCRMDGVPVDLSNAVYDRETHTLTIPLSGGFPMDGVMTLSYESQGTGFLDEEGKLTIQTQAEAQVEGAVSGEAASDAAHLSQPLELYGPIVIRPADIVIYAGGTPTDNTVVDGAAGSIAAQTNLPEPGFFMEMPQALMEKLRAAVDPAGTLEGEIDLSQYLTLVDGWDRMWGLELYDEDGYSEAFGKNLYRLVPITLGQDPLRMQFYDGERYIVSSEFNIGEALHKEYEMTIYPGHVEAGSVEAVLTVDGQKLGGYQLGFRPGTLTVRGTTDNLTTTEILDSGQALPETVELVTARVAADTHYYINESQLLVEDPERVELLVDNIVDTAHSESLKKLAGVILEQLPNQRRLRYQFQYLDLVDTSMGNAWVTADQPVEVYWPYPDGMGPEDAFTVIHYVGLDREYDGSRMESLVLGVDYTLEVYTTGQLPEEAPQFVRYLPLTAMEEGLFFTADGFSPYVLVWEGASVSGTGSGSLSATLNTSDHTAYLIGRGASGIQPLDTLTRGETAAIFFRLLTDQARADHWSTQDYYKDVPAESWYHNTVATLTGMGLLNGRPDGTFGGDAPISRAEFVAIAVRFFNPPEESAISFPDVSAEDWFAPAVAAGTALGLVEGRSDGTFAPEDSITRAEAAVILNRVLNRRPGGPLEDPGWVDNPADAWYYRDMLEASVSHPYRWTGTGEDRREIWTGRLEDPDWAALERYGPQ